MSSPGPSKGGEVINICLAMYRLLSRAVAKLPIAYHTSFLLMTGTSFTTI